LNGPETLEELGKEDTVEIHLTAWTSGLDEEDAGIKNYWMNFLTDKGVLSEIDLFRYGGNCARQEKVSGPGKEAGRRGPLKKRNKSSKHRGKPGGPWHSEGPLKTRSKN